MSQPPHGQLPPWVRQPEQPSGDVPPEDSAAGSSTDPYGAPQYGTTTRYDQAHYGTPQYGTPQYGTPQYGTPQYGTPQYGMPQYGQVPYGQPPYGQVPYGQPPYGQVPYGQPPYGQPSYTPYLYPGAVPGRNRRLIGWGIAAAAAALIVVVVALVAALSASTPEARVPAPTATRPATDLGDDPALDRLARDCHDGAMLACDDLFDLSELDSAYEEYGDTCAGRRPAGEWAYCTDVFTNSGAAAD